MCGIVAGANSEWVAETIVQMSYRGPDEQRLYHRGGFTIGHARLSIVAVKAAEAIQPAMTRKGRIVAFNGEIYNYQSLMPGARSELETLAAMLDEGLDPRQFVDGDYAIIYYDPSNQVVTLYRDRFGAIPLYYQTRPTLVSSERRHLFSPMEVPQHGKVVIDLRSEMIQHVDRIPHYGVTCDVGLDSINSFLRLFLYSVARRAQHSDVGFSLALSGGLDSSLIAFALRELKLQPKAAVCVALEKESTDLHYARMVAKECGLNLKEVIITPDQIAKDRAQILYHLDSPHMPTQLKWRGSIRNWYAALHSPSRVMLSGEGADELLGGYPSHFKDKEHPFQVAEKCLSTIRSMPSINLDRTNKLGLAHSIEYRMPYLDSTLSYLLLAGGRMRGKQLIRSTLRAIGAPAELCNREKYSDDEAKLEATLLS